MGGIILKLSQHPQFHLVLGMMMNVNCVFPPLSPSTYFCAFFTSLYDTEERRARALHHDEMETLIFIANFLATSSTLSVACMQTFSLHNDGSGVVNEREQISINAISCLHRKLS